MIIKGKRENYRVKWQTTGWGYAVPTVCIKRKLFGLPISYWKRVWDGDAENRLDAEKMLPTEMEQWFQDAVDEYEKNIEGWEKYNENRNRNN